MYCRDEQFMRLLDGYFCVYFLRCFANRGNKHQYNPLVSVKTVRLPNSYIILYLFRPINSSRNVLNRFYRGICQLKQYT